MAILFFVLFGFLVSLWLSSTLIYFALCVVQKTLKPTISELSLSLGVHCFGAFCLLGATVIYDQAHLSAGWLMAMLMVGVLTFAGLLFGYFELLGVDLSNN